MKPIFIVFIACLLAASSLQAQTMFAPPGSEWYHNMADSADGVFHSYYDGTDTIGGIPCRKITRVAETRDPWYGLGLHVHDLDPLYVYNNADTVFVYNLYFNRFTPLYVFNVHDGDTVTLPILPLDAAMLMILPGVDSVFSFVVDSVRMKLYDTTLLKTVYSHPIGNTLLPDSNYAYDYGFIHSGATGMYADRIGATPVGFIPTGAPAAYLADESEQSMGAVRCYSDPALAITMVAGVCGIMAPTNVDVLQVQVLSIFPNPAFDQLTIENLSAHSMIDIADMAGRSMHRALCTAGGNLYISVKQLSAGMYILKITGVDGVTYRRKISVVH